MQLPKRFTASHVTFFMMFYNFNFFRNQQNHKGVKLESISDSDPPSRGEVLREVTGTSRLC